MQIIEYTTLETKITEDILQSLVLEYLTRTTGKDWVGATFKLNDWYNTGKSNVPPSVTVTKVVNK